MHSSQMYTSSGPATTFRTSSLDFLQKEQCTVFSATSRIVPVGGSADRARGADPDLTVGALSLLLVDPRQKVHNRLSECGIEDGREVIAGNDLDLRAGDALGEFVG
jgi:hypothetical protein